MEKTNKQITTMLVIWVDTKTKKHYAETYKLMPNTKTAKKALRQNIRRRKRNIINQKKMKTAVKSFKKKPTADQLKTTYRTLDKLAKTGVIKKNKANRLKSRLSKKQKNTQK